MLGSDCWWRCALWNRSCVASSKLLPDRNICSDLFAIWLFFLVEIKPTWCILILLWHFSSPGFERSKKRGQEWLWRWRRWRGRWRRLWHSQHLLLIWIMNLRQVVNNDQERVRIWSEVHLKHVQPFLKIHPNPLLLFHLLLSDKKLPIKGGAFKRSSNS